MENIGRCILLRNTEPLKFSKFDPHPDSAFCVQYADSAFDFSMGFLKNYFLFFSFLMWNADQKWHCGMRGPAVVNAESVSGDEEFCIRQKDEPVFTVYEEYLTILQKAFKLFWYSSLLHRYRSTYRIKFTQLLRVTE